VLVVVAEASARGAWNGISMQGRTPNLGTKVYESAPTHKIGIALPRDGQLWLEIGLKNDW